MSGGRVVEGPVVGDKSVEWVSVEGEEGGELVPVTWKTVDVYETEVLLTIKVVVHYSVVRGEEGKDRSRYFYGLTNQSVFDAIKCDVEDSSAFHGPRAAEDFMEGDDTKVVVVSGERVDVDERWVPDV